MESGVPVPLAKEHSAVVLPPSSFPSSSSSSFTLAANVLLNLDSEVPMKSGQLLKKDNGWLAFLFPMFFPQFKDRLCILVGNYFFRFKDLDSEKPKGVPLPIDSVTCSVTNADENSGSKNDNLLILRTIRKTYIFKGRNRAECLSWLKAIKERKQLSIKETMGHASSHGAVQRINLVCEKLFKEKLKREGDASSMTTLDSTSVMNPMM